MKAMLMRQWSEPSQLEYAELYRAAPAPDEVCSPRAPATERWC
jgi:hypothetical protein